MLRRPSGRCTTTTASPPRHHKPLPTRPPSRYCDTTLLLVASVLFLALAWCTYMIADDYQVYVKLHKECMNKELAEVNAAKKFYLRLCSIESHVVEMKAEAQCAQLKPRIAETEEDLYATCSINTRSRMRDEDLSVTLRFVMIILDRITFYIVCTVVLLLCATLILLYWNGRSVTRKLDDYFTMPK